MMSLPTYEETPTLEMGPVLRHFWPPPSFFPPPPVFFALLHFMHRFCPNNLETYVFGLGRARVGKVVPCICFLARCFPLVQ